VGGRHRIPRGRNRRLPASGGLSVIAAGLGVLVVLAGSWAGYHLLSKPSCGTPIRVSVAVAPEIAPAVQASLGEWAATRPRVGDRCVVADIATVDPADVAAAIAGRHQAVLNGVGQANGKIRVPDVWVPDSSLWLQRLRAGGPDWVPEDAPPLARSPVVVAMPEPAASALGWPGRKQTWADMLPKLTSDISIRTGIVEPARDAAGLSGLLALTGAAGAAPGGTGQQATVRVLRALATGRSTVRDDLLQRFPRSTDLTSMSSALSAAPLSEQAVIAYNAKQPPVPLAALYVEPNAMPLDYPFTLLPGGAADKEEGARVIQEALAGDRYHNHLAEIGLRAADGSVGKGFTAPKGAPNLAQSPGPQPDPAAIDKVLSTWTTITSPGRLLAVIDVSGSMLEPVPTAGGASREQVTVEAARRGLTLFDDSWAVGLWTFSTQLDGNTDYRQLLPIGALSDQRQEVSNQLAAIKPKPDGGTGLYDTTLAAYKAVQSGWDAGRVNSVVIMTDGKNDDPQGMSLDQLVDELKKTIDPNRPIQVIALGIGSDVSETELRRITDTTGGGTFIAQDPSKIGDIFLKAIALRTGVKR